MTNVVKQSHDLNQDDRWFKLIQVTNVVHWWDWSFRWPSTHKKKNCFASMHCFSKAKVKDIPVMLWSPSQTAVARSKTYPCCVWEPKFVCHHLHPCANFKKLLVYVHPTIGCLLYPQWITLSLAWEETAPWSQKQASLHFPRKDHLQGGLSTTATTNGCVSPPQHEDCAFRAGRVPFWATCMEQRVVPADSRWFL